MKEACILYLCELFHGKKDCTFNKNVALKASQGLEGLNDWFPRPANSFAFA